MNEEIWSVISDFPRNPIVWVCAFYGLFCATISIRIVRELADALESIGITINQKDRKKWRKLISTILGAVFVAFVLLHLYSKVFPR